MIAACLMVHGCLSIAILLFILLVFEILFLTFLQHLIVYKLVYLSLVSFAFFVLHYFIKRNSFTLAIAPNNMASVLIDL